MRNKKNILIILFIIFGMYFVLNFKDHNFKRAVDACIAEVKNYLRLKLLIWMKQESSVKNKLKKKN